MDDSDTDDDDTDDKNMSIDADALRNDLDALEFKYQATILTPEKEQQLKAQIDEKREQLAELDDDYEYDGMDKSLTPSSSHQYACNLCGHIIKHDVQYNEIWHECSSCEQNTHHEHCG